MSYLLRFYYVVATTIILIFHLPFAAPLHIAASEGHLTIVKYLVTQGARVNRSDRWGGSALDDAHRHRHLQCTEYLQSVGASFGSKSQATNFITAASEGDLEEVSMLYRLGNIDVNECDYDKRTGEYKLFMGISLYNMYLHVN